MSKVLKQYEKYNPFKILGGRRILAKVIKVYDGDTIWVVTSELTGDNVRLKLRLLDINSEEIKDKTDKAFEARDYLSNLILDKDVECVFTDYDNFNRVLAYVYFQ